jgi:hypothetical protein
MLIGTGRRRATAIGGCRSAVVSKRKGPAAAGPLSGEVLLRYAAAGAMQ